MTDFKSNPPLSVYIHLPWCVRKCPYCDFNSHSVGSELLEEKYVQALLRDLDMELAVIQDRVVETIFIGGGTPSLFSADSLDRLLNGLRSRLNLCPDIEITLEANPGTAEAEKFKAYFELGINRLSIGVQSFNDEKLTVLGRIHSSSEALKAIEMAKNAGFENLNIDIMFGLPDQSIDNALEDLTTAIKQNPTHISWYQLTLEPNTVFYSKPPVLPEDDLIWHMQKQGQALLADYAYEHYEVSAYAKQDYQCQHNLNYWRFGDYLGIGAGAHGKITDKNQGKIQRTAKVRVPDSYMQKAGQSKVTAQRQHLEHQDICFEFMLNALRLKDGFETELFSKHTGLSLNVVEAELSKAEAEGLIAWQTDWIKPTDKGQRYLNNLIEIFLPE